MKWLRKKLHILLLDILKSDFSVICDNLSNIQYQQKIFTDNQNELLKKQADLKNEYEYKVDKLIKEDEAICNYYLEFKKEYDLNKNCIEGILEGLEEEIKKNTNESKEYVQLLHQNLREEVFRLIDVLEDKFSRIDKDLKSGLESLTNSLNSADLSHEDKRNELSKSLNDLLARLDLRVNEFEDFKTQMDAGIISLTKTKLLQLIEQKIEVFEGNINNKMSGLMIYVNDKTSGDRGQVYDVNLLKKLARLEGIKDSIDHRRSTEEVISIRDNLLKNKNDDIRQEAMINTLEWILGNQEWGENASS